MVTRLPDEYQEVEYLESTGTQYIVSDINVPYGKNQYKVLLDSEVTKLKSGSTNIVCGCSNGGNGGTWFGMTTDEKLTVGGGNNFTISPYKRINSEIIFGPSSIVVTIDNETVQRGRSGATNDKIAFFAASSGRYPSITKIYSAQIMQDDFLVANFIPCYRKSDNKPGMYNTVSGTFYTNSGTGEFLVGNNVYYDTTNLLESRRRILLTTPHLESPTPANPLTFKSNMTTKLKEGKVYFTPVQEGTGDPSPDNVRPISGWDGITVTRTGKNLFSGEQIWKLCTPYASISEDENGRYVTPGNVLDFINFPDGIFKEKTQYTFIMKTYASIKVAFYAVLYSDGSNRAIAAPVGLNTFAFVTAAGKTVKGIRPMNRSATRRFYYEESGVFEGNLTTDTYEPYQGSTITIPFPKTIYGGYVDLVNGEVVEKWKQMVVDENSTIGIFPWHGIQTDSATGTEYATALFRRTGDYPKGNNWASNLCDKLPYSTSYNKINHAYFYDGDSYGPAISLPTSLIGTTNETLKQYLSENSFVFCYQLRTPIHHTFIDGLTHLTLGDSITDLPNGRGSTGGYANSTATGADGCKFIYFELGWPTETYLQYSADYSRLNEFKLDGYTLRTDITSWGTAAASTMNLGEFAIVQGSSTDFQEDPLIYVYMSVPADCTDLESKRAYLSEHPLQLTYPKKKPISYTINQEDLRPLKGTNTIYSDTNGNIEIKFWKH